MKLGILNIPTLLSKFVYNFLFPQKTLDLRLMRCGGFLPAGSLFPIFNLYRSSRPFFHPKKLNYHLLQEFVLKLHNYFRYFPHINMPHHALLAKVKSDNIILERLSEVNYVKISRSGKITFKYENLYEM